MERAAPFVLNFESARAPRSNEEEATLIRRIKAGDAGPFFDLVHPHLIALWRMVRSRIKSDSDAQDILQETLLKAFRHLAQFRFASSFRTWLCRIAINQVWQTRRDAASWRVADIDELELERTWVTGRQDSPEARCEQLESVKLLSEAIKALPQKYRLVVQLRDLNELSIAETARTLFLTCGAVKTRHHRAHKLLLRHLAGSVDRHGMCNGTACKG
jgi:RNA polymerase sigma-70 factor (ECF subfamily)